MGFQVGGGNIEPVISKDQAINQVPEPKSRKEVQRFLGMVGYYRSFIPNFSETAAPLTDYLKGKKKRIWEWTETCQKAFKKLKGLLTEAPIRAPDFSKTFHVATDASAKGIGAMLSQDMDG